jgi:hypothetical protein
VVVVIVLVGAKGEADCGGDTCPLARRASGFFIKYKLQNYNQ